MKKFLAHLHIQTCFRIYIFVSKTQTSKKQKKLKKRKIKENKEEKEKENVAVANWGKSNKIK